MRKVEATIEINCSPEQIFNAFIQPKLLKQWWNVERSLVEPRQGGVYSLAWNVSKEGFQYVSTGIITVFNPAKELLIDHFVYFNPEKSILGPTFLSVRIESDDSSSKINFGSTASARAQWSGSSPLAGRAPAAPTTRRAAPRC